MGFIPSNWSLVFDFHENPPTNMGHVPIWRGYLNIPIRIYLYIYIYGWLILESRHGIYPDMSLVLDFYAYIAIYTFSIDENPPTNMGYTPIWRWSLTPMHISRYIHMRFDENPPTNMGFIPSNLSLVFDFHENPPTNMGHVPIRRGYLNIVTSIVPPLSI